MNLFAAQGRLAKNHPVAALVALLVVTVGLAFGFGLTESGGDVDDAFLPDDNPAAQADDLISERFAGTAVGSPVQLLVRGDVLTPAALQATIDTADAVLADPEIAALAAPGAPASSFAHVVQALAGDTPVGDLSQAEVDDLIGSAPEASAAQLDGFVAYDSSGVAVGGLGVISLIDSDDVDAVESAELAAQDAAAAVESGDVEIRTFSNGKLNKEIEDSQGSSTALLMGLAFVVIIALLALFYRTGSDVALSLTGLIVTIVWVFGLQGWMGPGGLDIIGGSNPMAIMIPVLLIGLTVDFALQITGKYRELIEAGTEVGEAISSAVKATGLPLLLAAVTTMISFFTNITNSLPPLRDFGIVAGLGVLFGFIVMTTFIPAARVLLDRRRVATGKEVKHRSLAEAIPGVGKVTTAISGAVVRRPLPILFGVAVVAVVAAFAAVNIDTTFSNTDFLPEDTEAFEDISFLDDNFGGGAGTTTVLIEGDITDDLLVRNIIDFELALADPATRPADVSGASSNSVFGLVQDLSTESGLDGDKFDPEFAEYFSNLDLGFIVAPETFRDLFDRLGDADPDGLSQVLSLGEGEAADLTLLRIPTSTGGDADKTTQLQDDLQALWQGSDDQIRLTGADILTVSIIDEMVGSQGQSIILTIIAALIVLMLYFGISEFRPVLGLLAVLPIGLVVLAVLGTMVALGISYNVITALITALTIGVGVDYTIHITHRFTEELEQAPGGSMTAAMERVMSTTGAALIGSALTTALGFAVLVFSPLAPMQQFGLLTAITIFYSLIAAFVVLPPMLVLWALYHRWRDAMDAGEEWDPVAGDEEPAASVMV